MRFPLKKDLLSNKKRLVIVLSIVIVLIIAIIGTSAVIDLSSSSNEVSAVLSVENEISRVDEIVSFNANSSKGEIELYAWDFGDGNSSTGSTTSHQYEFVGWYNVTLKVIGPDGEKDEDVRVIGIQQPDFEQYSQYGFARVFQRNQRVGAVARIPVGPNIGSPTIDLSCLAQSVVAIIEIEIYYRIGIQSTLYHTETINSAGGNIERSYHIEAADLPEEAYNEYVRFDFGFWIDTGVWASCDIDAISVFPIDNLQPPE